VIAASELDVLAATLLQHCTWPWDQPQWPPGAEDKFLALAAEMRSCLTDEDRTHYKPEACIEARGVEPWSDENVIRGKLRRLLYEQMLTLRAQWFIARDFPDSVLDSSLPDLAGKKNDDGLISAGLLKRHGPSSFLYRQTVVHINSIAPYELQLELARIAANCSDRLRLSLDPYDIHLAADFLFPLRKARWRGPAFNAEQVLQRLYEPNISTVMVRCPESPLEETYFSLHPVERLEITRTEKTRRLAFSFEELVPLNEEHRRVGYVGTFLFHCDLLLGAKCIEEVSFEHVDASYLLYRLDRYESRLRSKQTDKIKANAHHKIFYLVRSSFDEWRSLLIHTFPRDELVAEYLTGDHQKVI